MPAATFRWYMVDSIEFLNILKKLAIPIFNFRSPSVRKKVKKSKLFDTAIRKRFIPMAVFSYVKNFYKDEPYRSLFIYKMKSQEKSKNLSMEFFSDDVKIIISVLRKEARLHA